MELYGPEELVESLTIEMVLEYSGTSILSHSFLLSPMDTCDQNLVIILADWHQIAKRHGVKGAMSLP